MKNKETVILIAIAAILTLSLYANFRFWQASKIVKIENSAVITAVNNGGFASLTAERKTPASALVKSFKEVQITDQTEVKKAVTGGYADTIGKALGIALAEIAELKQVNATLQNRVKLIRLKNDTGAIATKTLKYSDRYLTAIFDPLTDSLDYHYNVQLNAVRRKKMNIWDIYSPDPKLRINNLRTFTIDATEPKHRWGLGLSAGYGYGFGGWQPYVGIGVNYNLIEF